MHFNVLIKVENFTRRLLWSIFAQSAYIVF